MNDNKKWSHRAGVLFWWTLAFLPIIVLIFYFLGNVVASSHSGIFDSPLTTTQLQAFCSLFNGLVPSYLINAFSDLFNQLGINVINEAVNPLCCVLSWFIMCWLYHLVVDFILMLIRVAQKFMDKVCD